MKRRVAIVIGTRPEAIKMAPVYYAMRESHRLEPFIVATGQHTDLVAMALGDFGITEYIDLGVMKEAQTLGYLVSAISSGIEEVFMREKPDLVLVHGDTTTTLVSALVAFYMRIPTGHVEAGLRSGKRWEPFPEEINRVLTDDLVDLLFPPTKRAEQNLSKFYRERFILTTGNTVVDAVLWMRENRLDHVELLPGLEDGNFILMTAHRRENWGEPMREIFEAAIELVRILKVPLVYPVHPNPRVRNLANEVFGNAGSDLRELIHLTPPMDYVTFLRHLRGARVVLSDSGGIQEEAPTFGVPVVLLRNVTERPEGVQAGVVMLAGTKKERIVELALKAWDMWPLSTSNPFGDGNASRRIAQAVEWFLGLRPEPPEPWG